MAIQSMALKWYDAGHTVIPLKPGTKKPAIKWRRFQQRRPTRNETQRMFRNHHGGYGVLMLGQLAVADFDNADVYHRWEYRKLPTFTVETYRGYHAYFLVADKPAHTYALPGIDIKCSGYVVGPGSPHPRGGHYTVHTSATIATISHLGQVGLARPEIPERQPTLQADRGANTQATDTLPYTRIDTRALKNRLSIVRLLTHYTHIPNTQERFIMARCPHPQHIDNHPSFCVDTIANRGRCFTPACALHHTRGMDVIELYARLENITTRQAILDLAVLA